MSDPIELFNRGDFKGAAEGLLPLYRENLQNSVLALFTGAALFRTDRPEEATVVWSLGDEAGSAVRGAARDPQAPSDIKAISRTADETLRAHFTALHKTAVAECDGDVARVANAIWTQTHTAPFKFQTPGQAPTIFYMPDLPAAPLTPRETFSWTQKLEDAAREIASEYRAAIEQDIQQTPYVPAETPTPEWETLRGTLDWAALHLFDKAERTGAAARFPKTLAALEPVDLVRMDGAPLEVFFSRLTPGAHIPPHFGLTNARLTVHLPLIVPEECAIRVVDTDYHWRAGEIIAFDDSFRHEAWNRSDTDRVVLIFECHHPDLTEDERRSIEHCFSVRQRWLDGRQAAIGA